MLKDESEISRQARWQRKHRAMGLCVLCSRPAFKGWRCKKHYEQHKITMRLRYIPKVRGRYKVGGTSLTESTSKRRTQKTATAKKASAKKRSTRAATAPRLSARSGSTAGKKVGRSKTAAKSGARKKAISGVRKSS